MKAQAFRNLHALVGGSLLALSSAHAASVLWVTEDTVINSDWNTLLTNAGYTVSVYANSGANPDPATVGAPYTVAQLNAFDLIIAASSNDSSGIGDHEATWTTITAPLLHMGSYGIDGGDWLWVGGTANATGTSTTDYLATDPIFGTIDPTVTPLFSATPRIANTVINDSGVKLAWETNGIQIARWAAGDAATGERAFFAGAAGSAATDRDVMHLTAEGQTVFLNLANNLSSIPEPSTALLGALGLLALLRRRR